MDKELNAKGIVEYGPELLPQKSGEGVYFSDIGLASFDESEYKVEGGLGCVTVTKIYYEV